MFAAQNECTGVQNRHHYMHILMRVMCIAWITMYHYVWSNYIPWLHLNGVLVRFSSESVHDLGVGGRHLAMSASVIYPPVPKRLNYALQSELQSHCLFTLQARRNRYGYGSTRTFCANHTRSYLLQPTT